MIDLAWDAWIVIQDSIKLGKIYYYAKISTSQIR